MIGGTEALILITAILIGGNNSPARTSTGSRIVEEIKTMWYSIAELNCDRTHRPALKAIELIAAKDLRWAPKSVP